MMGLLAVLLFGFLKAFIGSSVIVRLILLLAVHFRVVLLLTVFIFVVILQLGFALILLGVLVALRVVLVFLLVARCWGYR